MKDVILVQAWASFEASSSRYADVFVNGKHLCSALFNIPRPDVLPEELENESSTILGTEFSLRWQDIAPRESEIELSIRRKSSGAQIAIGPVSVMKADTPVVRHRRGSMSPVWGLEPNFERHQGLSEDMNTEIIEGVTQLLDISKHDRVLEIGAGSGTRGALLAPRCDEWIGVDFSGEALSQAIQNLKSHSNIALEQLEGFELDSVGSGSIHKLYCTSLLMFLDEWERFRLIREAYRVLAKGGAAYFDSLNLCGDLGWETFETLAKRDQESRQASVPKASTAQELTCYFERVGFERVHALAGDRLVAVVGHKPA